MSFNINFKIAHYNDEQQIEFYSIFKNLSHTVGCYYMGYILEDLETKTRLGFTTNRDLQNVYIENNMIEECHLWSRVSNYYSNTNKAHLILPWLMIRPETSKQKDLILFREEHGVGQDGVSFCTRTDRYREYLYFAPEKNELRFLQHLSANMHLIRASTHYFRFSALANIANNKTSTNFLFFGERE